MRTFLRPPLIPPRNVLHGGRNRVRSDVLDVVLVSEVLAHTPHPHLHIRVILHYINFHFIFLFNPFDSLSISVFRFVAVILLLFFLPSGDCEA